MDESIKHKDLFIYAYNWKHEGGVGTILVEYSTENRVKVMDIVHYGETLFYSDLYKKIHKYYF